MGINHIHITMVHRWGHCLWMLIIALSGSYCALY